MNTTTLVIGLLLAAMLVQYVLGWRQARNFSRDVTALRKAGGPGARVSVGVGKRRGRRVFIALATDGEGRLVTSALIMSGATVFSRAQPAPGLEGQPVRRLAGGTAPAPYGPTAVAGIAQAAGFLVSGRRTDPAATVG